MTTKVEITYNDDTIVVFSATLSELAARIKEQAVKGKPRVPITPFIIKFAFQNVEKHDSEKRIKSMLIKEHV